tara:strand:- start:153 stop:380 length:228 start_codon:yes stop_codon:yes gene_type:complete
MTLGVSATGFLSLKKKPVTPTAKGSPRQPLRNIKQLPREPTGLFSPTTSLCQRLQNAEQGMLSHAEDAVAIELSD